MTDTCSSHILFISVSSMQMWGQTSETPATLCCNPGLSVIFFIPFIVIIHALTWREGRNPKDTDRWDPKRSPPATTAATANKCCRKYGTACATCPNPLTHLKWTLVVLEKCSLRTQGSRGAAATPKTPTTRPYRRSANPWCLLPMSPVLQAPRRTSTCRWNPHLLGLKRWAECFRVLFVS